MTINQRILGMAFLLGLMLLGSGCATIAAKFKNDGKVETLIRTVPANRVFTFENLPHDSPDTVTFGHQFDPRFIRAGRDYKTEVELASRPSPWLIGDGVLLIVPVPIIGGVIAFGVDWMTGAWREYPPVMELPVPADTPIIAWMKPEDAAPTTVKKKEPVAVPEKTPSPEGTPVEGKREVKTPEPEAPSAKTPAEPTPSQKTSEEPRIIQLVY